MANMQSVGEGKQGKGIASILAIGTSNPPNFIHQDDYPDFYFRVTKSEHMTQLKEKFKRMCAKSTIQKRHFLLTEENLKENPNIGNYGAPSLNTRQQMLVDAIPELGKQAALKAIKEWGQPVSKITHLIFVTFSCFMMPGADYQLTKLLGLNSNVNRVMIYNQGCFAGGTALRLAKDLAENNPGSRVLVVCSESNAMGFHAPCETHVDAMVGQAVLADGASAAIVGANPDPFIESDPIFEIVSSSQAIVPDSEGSIVGHFLEMGMSYYLKKNCFSMFASYLESYLLDHVLSTIGKNNQHEWNSLFYAVHPGGSAVLDPIEEKLGLGKDKLRASRHVLSQYGNMGSACVIFILDELRRNSIELNKATTGEGMEYGVLFGFGPGLTVETLVLRSVLIV